MRWVSRIAGILVVATSLGTQIAAASLPRGKDARPTVCFSPVSELIPGYRFSATVPPGWKAVKVKQPVHLWEKLGADWILVPRKHAKSPSFRVNMSFSTMQTGRVERHGDYDGKQIALASGRTGCIVENRGGDGLFFAPPSIIERALSVPVPGVDDWSVQLIIEFKVIHQSEVDRLSASLFRSLRFLEPRKAKRGRAGTRHPSKD